jgi:hypothetical protein
MISFIHIGKTGGTTIHTLIHRKVKNYKEYHIEKNYNNKEQYIIWIRNPISRFVSAFNHAYYGVHTDPLTIKRFNIQYCLIPYLMENARKKAFTFSRVYDELVKSFSSANELAESLTSADEGIATRAKLLMKREEEHLFKGIGWYLNNGKFVEKNNSRIFFVGKLETMKEDIDALGLKLGLTLNSNLKLRENIYIDNSMKYLSPLAIENIINWYKTTDYAALEELYNHGWITKEFLESYYKYE